ncbi:hypothetical protein DS745_15050 [Anaerobacillus alkaliphilus]|uniref:Uncharacterized protein n=1 Tax=Anaerobacillus alkaliphilus TaxID=1548597 RepID=A0A4Q0VQV1_9BACI|nr:hypothetical protein [Anaerobacillus alkaliphilus]RXI99530.1 hypothetical protein DS745_15050 [Anaerobacillus alkaliphilus]
MKKTNIIQLLTVSFYLVFGIIVGVVFDKQWLSDEQMKYVQRLRVENDLLIQEKQSWVRYVENEFNDIRFYTTAEDEHFQNLNLLLGSIGVTLERLPETMGLYQQGIIISLGEELEETYGLPHLTLKAIPKHEVDVNLMYLSLLRMKEELLQ